MNGHIDEVRLWSIARTQSQIYSDKDKILSGKESGLEYYWRLDEGSGTIINNSSVLNQSATGTIIDAIFSEDIPFIPFWWGDSEVNLKNKWYLLTGATGELEFTESGNETYVYVDSSEISGSEGRLVVKQSLSLPVNTSTKEIKILGVIVSDGYKISEIYGTYRIDNGMTLWNKADKSFGFDVFITGNEELTEFEKDQILEAVSRISSAHKRGYLFFERSGGEEEDFDSFNNWMRRWEFYGEI